MTALEPERMPAYDLSARSFFDQHLPEHVPGREIKRRGYENSWSESSAENPKPKGEEKSGTHHEWDA